MKKLLLLSIVTLVCHAMLFSQGNCTSLRYQDTIFHSVEQSDNYYFGSAMAYGGLTPQDLYLDIYQPANDTLRLRPLIVYQFGGGFVIGWREEPDIPQYATYFAQLGYVVATIDYRIGLDPLDTGSTVRAFYRGVQDERSAIRYLCQNAAQFGIDTSRIILTGTSAGCFCAFANVYMNDSLRPVPTFGTTLEPSDLGCMDCSGNTDFGKHIPRALAIFNMWGAILDTNYIWKRLGVPTISFQGTLDPLVPYTYGYPFNLPIFPEVYGAVPINQRQTNQGILNVLHPLVGYGHEPELLAPWLNDTIYNYGRRFLWPLLEPQTSAITGDSIVCKNAVANYSVVNTTGSQYCWQLLGNGAITQNNNNAISVIWADTGTVSVNVTELNNIDAQGPTQSFQTQVIGHSHPGFTDTTSQLQVSFINLSGNAIGVYWTFGNGDTSTVANPVENYAAPGTYSIELFSNNGYCTDSVKGVVTVDTCPVARITDQITGMDGIFVVDTTNTISYTLNFGDGDSITTPVTHLFHQYLQYGTYIVTLKVTNAMGCVSNDTITVVIAKGPTGIAVVAESPATIICDANGCHISFTGASMNMEVLDVTGRKIFAQQIPGNYYFETAPLAQGIYLLKVSDQTSVTVKKIMKQ